MVQISILILIVFSFGVVNSASTPKCKLCDFSLNETQHFNATCVKLQAVTNVTWRSDSSEGMVHSCVPCTSIVSGSCGEKINKSKERNYLILEWEDVDDDYNYTLQFNFTKNTENGNQQWTLDNIALNVSDTLNDSNDFVYNGSNKVGFVDPLDYTRSFKCNYENSVSITNDTFNFSASVTFQNFRVQAFDFKKNNTFGNAATCNADSSSNKIVPIAVGAALGGLVVLVIIVFIIGRVVNYRKKSNSYEPLS